MSRSPERGSPRSTAVPTRRRMAATRVLGALADGAPVSTATGVYLHVLMAGVLFVLAAVPAGLVARGRPAVPAATGAP
ncbi:hypothetical protein [Nocardiopsis halotolerans]|uniref:hypothetical protein n=1 Tax=Nocardiopsis halotolerans TaxID=124252 RepID=UPI001F4C7ABA|nr:hypothetical protein [Nocardiopsis halotolerans]